MKYLLHDNGKILLKINTPNVLEGTVNGLSVFPVEEFPAGLDLWWIDAGELKPRPAMNVEVNGTILSHFPQGTRLIVEGVESILEGDFVELEFSLPGEYTISLECWPYLEQTINVIQD